MAVWRGIRGDVKAIARALGVQARTSASPAKLQLRATADGGRRTSAKSANAGGGHSRDASGRFVRQVATPAGRSGNGAARTASNGAGTQVLQRRGAGQGRVFGGLHRRGHIQRQCGAHPAYVDSPVCARTHCTRARRSHSGAAQQRQAGAGECLHA